MVRKVVLIVAAVLLLSCAAGAAFLAVVGGLDKPVLWVQRQLTAMSVRGGPEVVFEIDADAVRHRSYELLRPDIVSMLRNARLTFNARPTDTGVRVTAEDRQTVMDQLRRELGPKANVAPSNDGAILVSYSEGELHQRTIRVAEETRDLLTGRLSDLGMRVLVEVQPQQAGARLLVRMARSDDPKRLIALATKPGELTFRLIDDTTSPQKALSSGPPPNTDLLYGRPDYSKLPYLVEERVLLSGGDVIDAKPAFDQRTNEPVVTFRFSVAGTRKFSQVTGENVGRAFAVVVDGEVMAAPIIREPITGGSGQISGNFTLQSANELAAVLRHGELPARLKLVEERAAKGQ
jgi:preprotein translocase subunit SecD